MLSAIEAEYLGRVFWMYHPDYESRMRTIVVQVTDRHLIVRNEFGVRYKVPLAFSRSGLKEREKSPGARERDAADLRELLAMGKGGGVNDARRKPAVNL